MVPAPPIRRPPTDRIRHAALRALLEAGGSLESLERTRERILIYLHREDPGFALGPVRLRRLLARTPGIGLRVRYTVRRGVPPATRCPVCGDPLTPRINRTLDGASTRVGNRCRFCGYWSGSDARVPRRYRVVRTGIDGHDHSRDAATRSVGDASGSVR